MSFFFHVQVLASPVAGQAEVGNMALLSLGDIFKWVPSLQWTDLLDYASCPWYLVFRFAVCGMFSMVLGWSNTLLIQHVLSSLEWWWWYQNWSSACLGKSFLFFPIQPPGPDGILADAESLGEEYASRRWSWVSRKVSTGWKFPIVSWLSQEGIHRASILLFSSHSLKRVKSGDLDLGGPSVHHFYHPKEKCVSSALPHSCYGRKLIETDLAEGPLRSGSANVSTDV